jgi:hypothetical protein
MKLNIIIIAPLSLIVLLSGCDTCDKSECVEPPDPFKFRIIDKTSKEDLVFSEKPRYHPDTIRLFYYQDEEQIDLPLRKITNELHYNVFSNQLLPYVSAAENIKDFYLQLNYHDVDTLLIDVRQIDFECCTVFQYAQSYYNGHILKRSQDDYTVFLIEK